MSDTSWNVLAVDAILCLVAFWFHGNFMGISWDLMGCNLSSQEGRALLLGDAAHSTGGTLGQGANSALTDAVVLDKLLQATAPEKSVVQDVGVSFRGKIGDRLGASIPIYIYIYLFIYICIERESVCVCVNINIVYAYIEYTMASFRLMKFKHYNLPGKMEIAILHWWLLVDKPFMSCHHWLNPHESCLVVPTSCHTPCPWRSER